MSYVRFATKCDECGKRSEEYSKWPLAGFAGKGMEVTFSCLSWKKHPVWVTKKPFQDGDRMMVRWLCDIFGLMPNPYRTYTVLSVSGQTVAIG